MECWSGIPERIESPYAPIPYQSKADLTQPNHDNSFPEASDQGGSAGKLVLSQ